MECLVSNYFTYYILNLFNLLRMYQKFLIYLSFGLVGVEEGMVSFRISLPHQKSLEPNGKLKCSTKISELPDITRCSVMSWWPKMTYMTFERFHVFQRYLRKTWFDIPTKTFFVRILDTATGFDVYMFSKRNWIRYVPNKLSCHQTSSAGAQRCATKR